MLPRATCKLDCLPSTPEELLQRDLHVDAGGRVRRVSTAQIVAHVARHLLLVSLSVVLPTRGLIRKNFVRRSELLETVDGLHHLRLRLAHLLVRMPLQRELHVCTLDLQARRELVDAQHFVVVFLAVFETRESRADGPS